MEFIELLGSLGLWFPLNGKFGAIISSNISLPSRNFKGIIFSLFFLYFTLDSFYCRLEVQSSAVNKTDRVPDVMELTYNEQCVMLNARNLLDLSAVNVS